VYTFDEEQDLRKIAFMTAKL